MLLQRFFIRTYGCQMNERDSEALACLLEEHGWTQVFSETHADAIIFNTCSVRDQAERKVIGKVGLLKRLKQRNPELIIGLIGCMAQNHGEKLLSRFEHLDFVLGTSRLQRLPEVLAQVRREQRQCALTESDGDVMSGLRGHRPGGVSAGVAVMRGCNQFCTYCIVPHVRGREQSREIADIAAEIRTLVCGGTREILLLGQNVTAYGLSEARRAAGCGTTPDTSPFAALLRAVHEIPGLLRIRFTSPHPRYMNAAFVEAVTTLPKVCKAFHIPLQSGSDRILAAMRRGYTAAEYLEIIRQLRSRLPEVAFSTDVIVGFPGETEADFAATRALLAEVGFDMAYVFKYSPRQGTAAAAWPDPVRAAEKARRNQVLLADLEARTAASNRRYVGRSLQILVEGPSKRNPARWSGRSDTNKVVIFDPYPGLRPGALVSVSIRRVTAHSLFGNAAPTLPLPAPEPTQQETPQ